VGNTLTNEEKLALLSDVIFRARADLNDGKPLTEMRREHPPLRSLTEAAEDAFNAAWSESPPSMRNYVERDVAQFFYLLGQRDGFATAAETLNGDLREIGRLAKERL
jgi:hypothetical protein